MLIRTLLLSACCGALVAGLTPAPATGRADPDAVTVDGGRYYGALLAGRLHGKGRIEWNNGERYDGEFRAGRYAGQGTHVDPSGRRYEGGFVDGMFQGSGRYTTPDGDLYEGEFLRNTFTGSGRFSARDGSRYEGAFVNWRFQGQGRYSNAAGFVYEGEFRNGQLLGSGSITGPEGNRYQGEIQNWLPHGQGMLRYENGDVYVGGFEFGQQHGQGTLTRARPQADERAREDGNWHNGELENPARATQARLNIETALYRQGRLLDQAISALQPRRPDRINLFLLSVAGDGNQEVFRREVDFVTAAFERRFGVAGHALSLVNSRHTGATRPMATRTSVESALQALAARMDRQRDVLFMFLTSHGSEKHELILDQDSMRLRDLPATELARMLKQTGVRWKVVVVSACYSGGFIDALKDDGTLVITAARHDRRSFGCDDDNDFTFFGRAFFKESLPASGSFQEAFQRARALVQQWEHEDITGRGATPEDEYSYPQIHSPAPVERHLRQWWAQLR